MLTRYSNIIDGATREALKQVLADLKQSIYDLQAEFGSLMANFGEQADAVSDFLTGETRQNGFNPDDPSNYGLGPNDVPWVDVPDISSVPGAFDSANDPYAAYAEEVIASLGENVSGTKVHESHKARPLKCVPAPFEKWLAPFFFTFFWTGKCVPQLPK